MAYLSQNFYYQAIYTSDSFTGIVGIFETLGNALVTGSMATSIILYRSVVIKYLILRHELIIQFNSAYREGPDSTIFKLALFSKAFILLFAKYFIYNL